MAQTNTQKKTTIKALDENADFFFTISKQKKDFLSMT